MRGENMANLGTLDQSRYGLTGIANTIAQNAARSGNEWDRLAALIGGYVGSRMGENKRKKQDAKLDDIINQAKSNPNDPGYTVTPKGAIVGGTNHLSNQDYNYIMNGSEPVVSAGAGDNLPNDSAAINNAIQQANAAPKPSYANAFNPNYNMDYIREQARKQGISSGVLANREKAIQNEIAQSANAYYLPQIQAKLYGTKDNPATTDSILEGMNMLNELSKYSPETAKAYQALAVGGLQSNQKFNQAKELQQIKAVNQAVADARRLQNRIDYRNITKNTTNNSGTGGLKTADWLALQKRHSELGATLKELYPDGKLPLNDPDVQAYMQIGQTIGLGRNNNNTAQRPATQAPATNNQQQGARDVTGTPDAKKLQGEEPKQQPKQQPTESKNNWSIWDVNNKDLGRMRMEYIADPEKWRQKYPGFKTFSDYEDWLLNEGE